jgi:hypothetical protein
VAHRGLTLPTFGGLEPTKQDDEIQSVRDGVEAFRELIDCIGIRAMKIRHPEGASLGASSMDEVLIDGNPCTGAPRDGSRDIRAEACPGDDARQCQVVLSWRLLGRVHGSER